jgi:hypothetical protein
MIYKFNLALLVFGTMIAVSSLAPIAKADEWDKQTLITFSGPVDVPGKSLPAGTYVFKLAGSDSDRDIVQIFTKDQRQLLATILAVPTTRLSPAKATIVTLEEEPAGTPEVVKSWFYPGDIDGVEFLYRK